MSNGREEGIHRCFERPASGFPDRYELCAGHLCRTLFHRFSKRHNHAPIVSGVSKFRHRTQSAEID